MNEMVYGGSKGILDHGTVCDIEYYIYSHGTHPTAYIKLPADTDIDLVVHGGVTYGPGCPLPWMPEDKIDDSWWWGWDYAHYGDLFHLCDILDPDSNLKRWTVKEILEEDIIPAIFQVVKATAK